MKCANCGVEMGWNPPSGVGEVPADSPRIRKDRRQAGGLVAIVSRVGSTANQAAQGALGVELTATGNGCPLAFRMVNMSLDKLQLNLGWVEQFAIRGRWAGARDSLLRAAEVIDQMQAAAAESSLNEDGEALRKEIEAKIIPVAGDWDRLTPQEKAALTNERR